MNVLITHEESQKVCKAFRTLGHEAFSNDLQPCSGGFPEWHLQMDCYRALYLKQWDLIIGHPECTKVCVSGNGTYGTGKPKHAERLAAAKWIEQFWLNCIAACDKVCFENPVGVLPTLTKLPRPQYIQPWQFGHGETKKTALFLHNLPELQPTNIVEGREKRIWKMPPSPERAKLRSKTYTGIAEAFATQWGNTNIIELQNQLKLAI